MRPFDSRNNGNQKIGFTNSFGGQTPQSELYEWKRLPYESLREECSFYLNDVIEVYPSFPMLNEYIFLRKEKDCLVFGVKGESYEITYPLKTGNHLMLHTSRTCRVEFKIVDHMYEDASVRLKLLARHEYKKLSDKSWTSIVKEEWINKL